MERMYKIGAFSLYVLVVCIPFVLKKFLASLYGIDQEYMKAFVYASDFALLLLFTCGIYFIIMRREYVWFFGFSPLVISLFADNFSIGLYYGIRFSVLCIAIYGISEILRDNRKRMVRVCVLLGVLAVTESFLALLQWTSEGSIGLRILGEPIVDPFIQGVAKFVVDGDVLVRSYGTFLHPNILGCFLGIGFLSTVYVFIWVREYYGERYFYYRIIIGGACMFVILSGVILTFSRTSWIMLDSMLILISLYGFFTRRKWRRELFVIYGVSYIILYSILGHFVLSRITSISHDPGVGLRGKYMEVGWEIIKDRPIIGVGIGNSMIHAEEHGVYNALLLFEEWQKQPTHNLYVLILAELGIAGFILFVYFVSKNAYGFLSLKGTSREWEMVLMGTLLIFILGVGMFDHFLWTIEQGRLMFVLVFGMVRGIRPRS